MSPEDPTVDEATAAPPAESLQATEPEASGEPEAAASEPEEEAPPTPAEAYRQALDQYLAGELNEALRIVDAVLDSGEETELRPRLERLRKRAEDRIAREGGTIEPKEEPKAEGELISAPSKDDADAKTEDAPTEDAPTEEAPAEEAKAEADEAPAEEAKAEEAPAEDAKTEEKPAETPEAKTEEKPAEAAEAKAEPETKPAEPKPKSDSDAKRRPSSESGRQRPSGVSSGKLPQQQGGPPRQGRPPGSRQQKRPPGRRPNAPPMPPALRGELDRIGNSMEILSKTVRGVENHTLKVAEAYQRISQHHKRKEQAYDQLYEELRQYKENFLLQAQKPLYKDIILLFDGVNRSYKAVDGGEEDQLSKERVLEMLGHIKDEILEVLYRRDIEPIEEHPEVLDIEFQKPVRRIETDDPEKDRRIEQVIREGFRMDGALLRPQEVVVLRCTKTDERES